MSLIVIVGNPIPPFQPSSMVKAAAWQMPAGWTVVPGWKADTGSVVVGNALKVLGGKASARVVVTIAFSGGSAPLGGGISQKAQLLVGTKVVATSDEVTGESGTLNIDRSVPVNAGDLLTVQVMCTITGLGGGTPTTISPGAGTSVQIM
ncbi:hypothetical protein [Nocardia arthritidis]|uniref:Uncharacterized protein n=1 Tax=Nocardia arthritidis TaxID=228602 RepID=A0A6G9YTM9_9NOCA|nr:hypothetical protein [Nocardia arthritidis]QIS16568.1 hypothetical protein F5544_43825 [Nocardia arthritidis]